MSLRARIGAGAVVAGALLLVVDGVPSPTRAAVWIVAGGLAVAAFFGIVERSLTAPESARPPAVGSGYEVPVPGDEIAAMDEYARRTFLRDYAAATLARERGVDRSTAADAVEAGTWTDHEAAATYLSDATSRAPLRVRLRLWWTKGSLERWWLDRVVAALAAERGESA